MDLLCYGSVLTEAAMDGRVAIRLGIVLRVVGDVGRRLSLVSLYTLFTTELLGSTCYCFMGFWVLRYTLFMIMLLLPMCYLLFMTRSLC
jgi:hypothetical protein